MRYTALFDTMTWECMAIYHPTWLDSLTKQRPFLEAPASMHNTDNRLQCAIAAAHHFTKIYLDSAHPGIESAVDSVRTPCGGHGSRRAPRGAVVSRDRRPCPRTD